MKNKKTAAMAIAIIGLFLSTLFVCAGEEEQKPKELPIKSWLKIGPIETPMPAFGSVENLRGSVFELKNLLHLEQIEVKEWWPQKGDLVKWDKSLSFLWTIETVDLTGLVIKEGLRKEIPQIVFLATYIDVTRWVKAKLEVCSHHLVQVYVDGTPVLTKISSQKPENEKEQIESLSVSQDLKLETGKHILLIKMLKDLHNGSDWDLKASVKYGPEAKEQDLNITTSPRHPMNIKHLLDGPKVTGVSISADGKIAAVSIRQTLPPGETSDSWIELRRIMDGRILQTFRGGMKISGIQWAPKGNRFSYTSSENGKSTLWVVDLDSGSTFYLLRDMDDLSDHTWSPDGTFIVYSLTEKTEKDNSGVFKLEGMPDRWPWYRYRDFLYLVTVPEGVKRRLTSGKLSTALNGISPDSKKLIFSQQVSDLSERPYSKNELFVLDLETLKSDLLFSTRWDYSAQWSADGKKILVTGGPSLFGDAGTNVSPGMIPNDYDTQAYIFTIETKQVEPITRNFDPSVDQAIWSQTEECLYFRATDRSSVHLFRYDLKRKKFELIQTGVEVLDQIDIAKSSPFAVYTGSSPTVPKKAFMMDLKNKRFRLLTDPEEKDFQHVELDKVERWTFKNKRGREIEGTIYLPPRFDSTKKYPCIVYYYGGTSPVTLDFGGRYPKNLYAAQGYVVYVLQPSGAVGFGQEFSALHVNDWGIIVADEIIDGVKQFLSAHPFVDPRRVGCIGASYGGFMTMLLQTRTDMFAAAVSHAGISSISSYWGEGYWGYLYNAVAAANSFPWNRKDIYVDQSALFHADKINTPLLLLHGISDTNVPLGESIQLYTALRLLGREVELVQVEGQDHLILEYSKRIGWLKSILAWFDRWLKDQPEWWQDLYPEKR